MQGIMMPGADFLHAAQHEPGGIDALTGYLRLDQSTPQSLSSSPVFNAGTATRIPFYSGTKTLTDSANLAFVNDILNTIAVNTAGLVVASTEIWVKPGTTIQATIDGITDATASKPYCVRVPPGIYTEVIYMKAYVSLKGCGRHCTKITFNHDSNPSICTVHWNNMVSIEDMAIEAPTVGIPIGDWNFIGSDLSNCTVTVNNCFLYGSSDLSMCVYSGSVIHIYNCNCYTEWDGFGVWGVASTYYIYNVDVIVDGSAHGVIGILRPYGGGVFYVYNLRIAGSSEGGGGVECSIISALYDPTVVIKMYNVEVDFTSTDAVVHGIESVDGSVVGYNCRIQTSGIAGSYDLKRTSGSIELHNSNYTTTSGTITGNAQIPGTAYVGGLVASANLDIGAFSLTASKFVSNVVTGTSPYACTSTTLNTNLNADLLDGNHASAFEAALTKGNLTASGAISLDQTRQVIGGAAAISHSAAAGYVHLPTGGSSNQILKNSGASGTGSWGVVTENNGALGSITTISMSGQLTNTLATGTAPLAVTSTTVCANLNADLWDDKHWSDLKEQFTLTIDGGGGEITTGIKKDFRVPYDCTITGWTIFSSDGTSGSIVIDIWSTSYGYWPPLDASSITNGHEPFITSSVQNRDLDIADWSGETLSEGDILRFNVDSVTSLKAITLFLHIARR
jgi:hypothetical protein